MVGLLGSDADPVVEERMRQVLTGKPRDEIPGEVDRIELDMGEGVEERDPARRRAKRTAFWHRLGRGVGGGEDRRRLAGKSCAVGRGGQRARAAFSTSPTWPGTLTLCHTPRMMPVPSIRKVARSMPIYFRPYMLFSTHTP